MSELTSVVAAAVGLMFVHHGSPCYHHHRTHIVKGSDEDLVEITVVFYP